MDSDRIIGAGKQAAGDVQEGIGSLIGDNRTQAKGQEIGRASCRERV